MFKHTPAQASEAWVQALRSGDYKQTSDQLRDDDHFCCLGVACDLFLKMEGRGAWDQLNAFSAGPYDRSSADLPDRVRDWLGLSVARGRLVDKIIYDAETDLWTKNLAGLNDDAGYSFAAIADVIEAGKVELA